MPNNLDMGGFGAPGLPVYRGVNDCIRTDAANIAGDLMDLRVGGASRWVVSPQDAYVPSYAQISHTNGVSTYCQIYSAPTAAGMQVQVQSGATGYVYLADGNGWRIGSQGGGQVYAAAGWWLGSAHSFRWGDNATGGAGTADLFLYRNAAGVLIQRNGTNAQQSILSRSWTDSSNYSWYRTAWNTSTLLMMAEGAGSGTDGSVAFNDAVLATTATVGFVMLPSCAGTPTGVPADIPTGQCPAVIDSSANRIWIYVGGAWKYAALT